MMEWVQIWIVSYLFISCSSYRTRPLPINASTPTTTTEHPVPINRKWAEQAMGIHIANMTEKLIRDLIDKFEIAAKAIGEYNDPDATDLAYIRGSTLDTFGLMLEIYHTFANMDDFTNNKYTMKEYLDAYHVIQGYYNELKKKKEIYMTTVKNMKIIEDLKEDLYTKMNAICPTHKKRFMKMPDSIVKHKDEIIHNLRAYRVIDECHDENAVKNLFVEAEWPTRRQFADARNFNESNDNEYKVLKWKMKGEQFKAIEDIKNDLFS